MIAIVLDVVRTTTRNQYGICPGRSTSRKDGDPPRLTDWLEATLDDIAFGGAKSATERPEGYASDDPLTFADLWGARIEQDRRRMEADGGGRRVNLEVMTTNLTQARPYRLPFESPKLFFDPVELAPLFSSRVIEFMKRQRRVSAHEQDELAAIAENQGLIPLPHPPTCLSSSRSA